jgi:Zn-dependent peptidase ImmA (M78 family)/transcriptional regulator with XRE-family HTH domain
MTVSHRELGRRIAQARQLRGLSQVELSEAVGLSQSAVSRIESGERSVDSIELAELAAALDLSVLDLLEKTRPLPTALAARLSRRESPGLESAIDRGRLYGEISNLLDEVGFTVTSHTRVQIPTVDGRPREQGRELAEFVRTHFLALSPEQPVDRLPEVTEEKLGLDVALEPLAEGIDGICLQTSYSVALVNSEAVAGRQRFTLAHEICHYLCGDSKPIRIDEGIFGHRGAEEERANAFAAHLLLPVEGIRSFVGGADFDLGILAKLQYHYWVSLEALLWQLKNDGFISESQRRNWRGIGSGLLARQTGYFEAWAEMEATRGQRRPPRLLLHRALQAYSQGALGAGPLAEILNQEPERLKRHLGEEGLTEVRISDSLA